MLLPWFAALISKFLLFMMFMMVLVFFSFLAHEVSHIVFSSSLLSTFMLACIPMDIDVWVFSVMSLMYFKLSDFCHQEDTVSIFGL